MLSKRIHWRLGAVILAVCLFVFGATAVFAFEGRGDEETVIIAADEVIADDLYVGANTLIINGTVEGDLFFGANEVEINGTVAGDVIGGGNSLIINGTIGDDILFGGTALIIADGASIAGDVLAGGTGIEIASGATVGNDVLFGAVGALLNGTIGGDVHGGGNGVEINGTIDGNVELDVGDPGSSMPFDPTLFNPNAPTNTPRATPGLTVGGDASIGGDLSYASSARAEVPATAVAGELIFDEVIPETAEQSSFATQLGTTAWAAAQRWVILLLLGWLLLRLMPNLVKGSAVQFNNNPGKGLLSGVLLYFGWPIALLILLALVILLAALLGAINVSWLSTAIIWLGIAVIVVEVILFILTLVFLCAILVSWLIGSRIVSDQSMPIIPLALGTLIVVILTAIPYLGSLVSFVVGIAGLGSLWLWWRDGRATDNGLKTAAAG
ncbi:MAG: polymer-forming cytoskeletal protein [Anaerolineales bacterium]|nr:polymer-forming cytoskeletal protein [Anaerolineales bacterium]